MKIDRLIGILSVLLQEEKVTAQGSGGGIRIKDARRLFAGSHLEVMGKIDLFSNEELFLSKKFPAVGGTTLGSYFVSSTSSHYDLAIKKIKAHQKKCKVNKEAVRSGGNLENIGGTGKYVKDMVFPDGCVMFRLTAKKLGNENFYKGKFYD